MTTLQHTGLRKHAPCSQKILTRIRTYAEERVLDISFHVAKS